MLPFLLPSNDGARPGTPFRYRGLYVESKWGPDLMTLDDWRHLIDEMAFLRMNSLGAGVYGCWGVQYDGKRTEFLMVPFPGHPELQTPITVRWHSPAAGVERTLTYLPRMFEEDFLGQVVAYGREREIAVRPHFNGPGHSTLIPRVYPDVSSKDEAGNPTGFGYCLTAERTYQLLFSLYDSVIARHLRPNGGEWWHLGLDEVEPYAGIDEADPSRVVDPWCRCPGCAGRSKPRLLVDFAIRSIEHLLSQGMKEITLWHDALAKTQAYPLFTEELAKRGLADKVAVQWWRYDDPPLAVQAHQLRSWVTPMAGYWSNLFHHEYVANIRSMATEGVAAGSEGMDAYCIYDPAYFQSYAAVAAMGLDPALDAASFEAAFARWLFEGQAVPAGFSHARTLFDSSYGPLGTLLDSLLADWWTDSARRHVRYPRDQIAQLAADPLRLGQALIAVRNQAEVLRAACAGAAPRAADERRRRLLEEYAGEAGKLAGTVEAFRLAAAGWNHYRRARQGAMRVEMVDALTRAQAAFQSARQAVHDVMAVLERVKAPYLGPSVLRDLTPLYRWCATSHDRVRDLRQQVEAGGLDDLPAL
jgi:hypothetical protein